LSGSRKHLLGIDIGGTKVAAGVVDESGRVHSFVVEPTRPGEGPERVLEVGRRALGGEEVGAVGVACGGPLDAARGTVSPLHLPWWKDVPIRALAEQAYGVPAALENDATAAAAGEHRFGAGVGTRNMVYLTLSTGVGGGAVVDGVLFRGGAGNGGEFGHVTVDWRGRPCHGCGRLGCLEAYASGTSIAERAREAGLDAASAEDVAAAARADDPVAEAVWAETAEALAAGLTSIVNLFEPERVVLGGGVTSSGEQLLGPVRERVRRDALGPAAATAEVVLSALGEHVGVVGAAAIALEAEAARG
jgi:glucokinase